MTAASDQLRRCVRSVAVKRGASRQAVSAGFAICTASLREKGYLDASGRAPTLKGFLRSIELSNQAEHAEAMEAYERMLERIRVHRHQRGAKARGATNRVPCQLEPALIVLVCCRPAVGAASAMSSASM